MNVRLGARLLLQMTIVACVAASGCDTRTAEDDIREGFAAYRTAVLAGDGAAAVALLDRATLDWYDTTATLAANSENGTISKATLLRKLLVLQLRQEFYQDELATMTAGQVYDEGLERGWLSRSSVENAEITKIEFSGPRAWIFLSGQNNASAFSAIEEEGRWKISLIESIRSTNVRLTRDAAARQMLDGPYLIQVLESDGKRVDRKLFQGPRARPTSRPSSQPK